MAMYIVFYYEIIFSSFSEQQRENDRSLRRAGREIERERRKLEDEERKIVIIYMCECVEFPWIKANLFLFRMFVGKRKWRLKKQLRKGTKMLAHCWPSN